LEEIDYGLHYYDGLAGVSRERMGTRNLHNIGQATGGIKAVADAGMAVLFVVIPLAGRRAVPPCGPACLGSASGSPGDPPRPAGRGFRRR
jgi:hypothetical protein